jgi:hypothetical protein
MEKRGLLFTPSYQDTTKLIPSIANGGTHWLLTFSSKVKTGKDILLRKAIDLDSLSVNQ